MCSWQPIIGAELNGTFGITVVLRRWIREGWELATENRDVFDVVGADRIALGYH